MTSQTLPGACPESLWRTVTHGTLRRRIVCFDRTIVKWPYGTLRRPTGGAGRKETKNDAPFLYAEPNT
jgi:hypothetical protein